MRVLLLVNATASSVTARKRVMIRKLLAAQHEVEVAETSRRGHATRLAACRRERRLRRRRGARGRRHAQRGGRRACCTATPRSRRSPAARPTSTRARSAIRTMRSPPRACSSPSLGRDATKRIGVGIANRRPFLFNTGIGFDAAVIRRVERYGELKRYAVASAARRRRVRGVLPPRGHADAPSTSSSTAGETIEDVRFAIVSKTDPYTYLGRLPLARRTGCRARPAARPHRVPPARLVTLVGGAAVGDAQGQVPCAPPRCRAPRATCTA